MKLLVCLFLAGNKKTADREEQHLYRPYLYSYNIVETNPAHAALEPSPAGSRAFAGLNLYDGVDTDRDILRPGIICTRTLADVQVGDADLYEKRRADRRLRSSCFRCVDVYRKCVCPANRSHRAGYPFTSTPGTRSHRLA